MVSIDWGSSSYTRGGEEREIGREGGRGGEGMGGGEGERTQVMKRGGVREGVLLKVYKGREETSNEIKCCVTHNRNTRDREETGDETG